MILSAEAARALSHRVLCYAPYSNFHPIVGRWEMTILNALKLRGAEVRYFLCDGLYSDCDLFNNVHVPRHALACQECQARSTNLAFDMGMAYEWLGRYLCPEDYLQAQHWAYSLGEDELFSATYGEWEIGKWTESSVHTSFRMSHLDLGNPQAQKVYRGYLFGGLLTCLGLERLFSEYHPDVLFLFNGRLSVTRIALEMALRQGIRVICYERGTRPETLALFENVDCLSLQSIKRMWQDWGNIPLNWSELEKISQHMLRRQYGENTNWTPFSPPSQNCDDLYRQLRLAVNRPVWVLFTSSDDEVVAAEDWRGPFAKQIDWIQETIAYARQHAGIDLIIRVHPNTGGNRSGGRNVQQLQEMEQLRTALPPNVRVVMPDDSVSSYSLMDIATLGLVYQSTVGLEMTCKGKQVIIAAGNYVSGLPFVQTVEAVDEYKNMLDAMLTLPINYTSVEIQRLAHRFAFGFHFRWSIPFPLVRMPNPFTGELAYDSTEALQPGREPNLDRVCRIILEGEPICPPPSPVECLRSEMEDAKWFARRSDQRSIGALAPSDWQNRYGKYIARLYRAMKNPRRWPEYAARLYRRIGQLVP